MADIAKNKAAALAYSTDEPAPRVLASGTDYAADCIIKAAEKADVTIVKDSVLAEILSRYPAGSYIPEQTYAAVAAVLVFADALGKADL